MKRLWMFSGLLALVFTASAVIAVAVLDISPLIAVLTLLTIVAAVMTSWRGLTQIVWRGTDEHLLKLPWRPAKSKQAGDQHHFTPPRLHAFVTRLVAHTAPSAVFNRSIAPA